MGEREELVHQLQKNRVYWRKCKYMDLVRTTEQIGDKKRVCISRPHMYLYYIHMLQNRKPKITTYYSLVYKSTLTMFPIPNRLKQSLLQRLCLFENWKSAGLVKQVSCSKHHIEKVYFSDVHMELLKKQMVFTISSM